VRVTRNIVLMLLVVGSLASVSATPGGPPVGGCPPKFHLHPLSHEHNGHVHTHVGNSFDQNGDGLICVKHVSVDGSVHVHIDNVVGK
jgi:hypothetical protein